MKDRGLAAYIAELVGTMFLTFFITSVTVLYVASGATAQFGSDFAVVGLVNAFVLIALVIGIGSVSGGHFNPVVTIGAAVNRRIDPIDALVYVLAQLSGGVLGALLTKALLSDEGRASDYGATTISNLLGGNLQGALVEGIGAFVLVVAFLSVTYGPVTNGLNARREWAPFTYGITLGFLVMVLGPLTGGAFNPARWFGPALVGNHFSSVWPYVVGPLVGALLAAGFYKLVLEGGAAETTSTTPTAKPPAPSPPPGGGPPPPRPPQPPASPPGGILGS